MTPFDQRASGVVSTSAVARGYSRDAPGQAVAPGWAGCISVGLGKVLIMGWPRELTKTRRAMALRREPWVAGRAGFTGAEPREENG